MEAAIKCSCICCSGRASFGGFRGFSSVGGNYLATLRDSAINPLYALLLFLDKTEKYTMLKNEAIMNMKTMKKKTTTLTRRKW